MKIYKIEKKIRERLKKAIQKKDFEEIYQIEKQAQRSSSECLDDLIIDLPENYVEWAEIKKANELLSTMTLKDALQNLKYFYWVNHKNPKVLFILKTGEKIGTPLSKQEELISLSSVEQISVKCLSKQTKETYESMI